MLFLWIQEEDFEWGSPTLPATSQLIKPISVEIAKACSRWRKHVQQVCEREPHLFMFGRF